MRRLCVCLRCAAIGSFLLTARHYSSSDLTAGGLGEKTRDSLAYLFRYHYTQNTNLEVLDDPIRPEHLPAKDAYIRLSKGDQVIVVEFSIHPQGSVDSVWVKLAHSQDVQRQVRNHDLARFFVPTDSTS